MSELEIKDQPVLSFKRSLRFTLQGVKYRIFRAAVSVCVIAVAIAFLSTILSESIIKRNVSNQARTELSEIRLPERWLTRLSIPPSPEQVIDELSETRNETGAVGYYRSFTDLDDEGYEAMLAEIRTADGIFQFLEDIGYLRRRQLVEKREGVQILDHFTTPEAIEAFFNTLKTMPSVSFFMEREAMETFVADWPKTRQQLDQMRENIQSSIDSLATSLGGQPLEEALAVNQTAIRNAGFLLPDADAEKLSQQVEAIKETGQVNATLQIPTIRQVLSARLDKLPADVTVEMMWNKVLNSENGARWFQEQLQKQGHQLASLEPQRLNALAERQARENKLEGAASKTRDTEGGFMGIGKRLTWLVMVSMLLCAVGISNAMLMSVTERFREIATLKCLGALDTFIMLVFMLEAAVLGLVGGLAGALLGLLLSISRTFISFKTLIFEVMPWADLFTGLVLAVVAGVVLAVLAAMYPSFKASRLAPMEAMRVE